MEIWTTMAITTVSVKSALSVNEILTPADICCNALGSCPFPPHSFVLQFCQCALNTHIVKAVSPCMSLVLCCVVVLKHDWIVPQNRAAYYAVHSRAMWMVYLVMRWRQCKTTPGTSNYLCQPETIPPFKGFCLNIDGYTLSFLKHTVYPSAWYKLLLAEKCTQGE